MNSTTDVVAGVNAGAEFAVPGREANETLPAGWLDKGKASFVVISCNYSMYGGQTNRNFSAKYELIRKQIICLCTNQIGKFIIPIQLNTKTNRIVYYSAHT